MAISVTQRGDLGTTTNRSTYDDTTDGALAATPGDNPCVAHLSLSRGSSTDPTFPSTITVAGVSLSLLASLVYKTTGTNRIGIGVYRGYGAWSGTSWSTGALGYTATGMRLDVFELVGADKTTPVPAGQYASASGLIDDAQTLSATLPSAPASTSRCFAAVGRNVTGTTDLLTRTNWTELDVDAHGTPSKLLKSDWRSDASEQTGSVTGNTGIANLLTGIIVYEVAEAATGITWEAGMVPVGF